MTPAEILTAARELLIENGAWDTLWEWHWDNDNEPEVTQAEVLAALDAAIELTRREEG